MRRIGVGLRGSLLAEVTSGLQDGDRVLLGDSSKYKAGEQVTPRLQSEPADDVMREEGGMIDPQASDQSSGQASGKGGEK
jgi:hypothetical protein